MGSQQRGLNFCISDRLREPKHTRGQRERFLVGQNRTKCANFRGSPLFSSYVQHKNRKINNQLHKNRKINNQFT